MKFLAAVVLCPLLLITACGEPPATPGDAAAQPAPAAQVPAKGKDLLTEAKIGQFVIYQREMAPHTKELLGLGMKAVGKSSSEAAADPAPPKAPAYEAKQQARNAFEQEYGKGAAAALLKFEAELIENQRRLIEALTQK